MPVPARPGIVAVTAVLCMLLSGCFLSFDTRRAGNEVDWGPFLRCDTGPGGERRVRAAGPLYETAKFPDGWNLLAVRPFYSRIDD